MPRFPVAFGKRKSAAHATDDEPPVSSFRVLERTEVVPGDKAYDIVRKPIPALGRGIDLGRPQIQPGTLGAEDNLFSGLNKREMNRGSGSSNTTKTASTDTSSRHSAVSTTPSSAPPPSDSSNHLQQQQQQQLQLLDETRSTSQKLYGDIPVPPIPKSSSGFFNRAGRTFSFGSRKNQPPPMSSETSPPFSAYGDSVGRPRAMTTSTTSTATPPKIDDQEFNLDLGGDFGKMFTGSSFDKRASVATVRDDANRAAPRSLTGNRGTQHSPLHGENGTKPPLSPFSASSDTSNDGLLSASNSHDRPPPVPRHASPLMHKSRPSDIMEDEDASLLKQSLAASRVLDEPSSGSGRYRRNEDPSTLSWRDKKEENMFDSGLLHTARMANRYVARAPSPPRNRVMTPAQFERYKEEKERNAGKTATQAKEPTKTDDGDEDEDSYEDDDDEVEKSRQAVKERRKQEANMAVYRQQMMKVTGESPSPLPRPGLPSTMSAPTFNSGAGVGGVAAGSDGSDEDEEVPLAILAAHGFPNKNRPPTRLSSVGSTPNVRTSLGPSPQPSKPAECAVGGNSNTSGGQPRGSHLPAFARNLPQDPFIGAGLVKPSPRESLAMGGGAPAPGPQPALPPGGLVGVIANEERSRAMRRGSPQLDGKMNILGGTNSGFDPLAGIPSHTMYGMGGSPSMPQLPTMGNGAMGMGGGMGMPMGLNTLGLGGGMNMGMGHRGGGIMPGMLTPGDQAQLQMNQQMQQFMQMQMQFMQMMAANQGQGGGMPQHLTSQSMGETSRRSFIGDQGIGVSLEAPRPDPRTRTMSMVQPSSASWVQPPGPGFAPSILIQGAGYAPSIAPSERSNIGLPGRYRPVSHIPPPQDSMRRVSTMSGAISSWEGSMKSTPPPPGAKSGSNSDDDDDEEGWASMKAKREKKKSMWRSKKGVSKELGIFMS